MLLIKTLFFLFPDYINTLSLQSSFLFFTSQIYFTLFQCFFLRKSFKSILLPLKKKTVVRTQHKIYSQQTFGAQYRIFNYRHRVVRRISRPYSSCVTEISYSLNSNPLLFFPCTPWQPPFHSLLLNLTVLDTSYKWTHAVFLLLWVANSWRYLRWWVETLNIVKISMQPERSIDSMQSLSKF